MIKKVIFSLLLVIGSFFLISILVSSYSINNVFKSEIYTSYRNKLNSYLAKHHDYSKINNEKVLALIEEIQTPFSTPEEQFASHHRFVQSLRRLTSYPSQLKLNEEEKQFVIDLIRWIFLKADLKSEMQDYLYSYVPMPDGELGPYLTKTLGTLKKNAQFLNSLNHHLSFKYDDQFIDGNLPFFVAKIGQTDLFRLGQPGYSEEFITFLKSQHSHLYVNLMKRYGYEWHLVEKIESLEKMLPNVSVVTLDKNSHFYFQEDYPEELDSEKFKTLFMEQLFDRTGNYYWSKNLDTTQWKIQVRGLLDHIHMTTFNNESKLTKKERLDFIEISYLAILDMLVDKLQPASMNITCRQGMDRGPSLMVLWLWQQSLMDKQQLAALLLAPPLILHNRPSHLTRIERFVTAAERLQLE